MIKISEDFYSEESSIKGRFGRLQRRRKSQFDIDPSTGLVFGLGIESLQRKDNSLMLKDVAIVYRQLGLYFIPFINFIIIIYLQGMYQKTLLIFQHLRLELFH